MSLTPTTSIPLGFNAPSFILTDVISGAKLSYSDVRGEKGTLVMFICNHCPYVIHVRSELILLANDYLKKGVGFVAISSNDVVNYPDDAPERMKELALKEKFPFPYLYDESQEIAKEYNAACTPDFMLFDENELCVYRGRLDESRPNSGVPVTGKDMRAAINMMTQGKEMTLPQYPSMGCNIKWKR